MAQSRHCEACHLHMRSQWITGKHVACSEEANEQELVTHPLQLRVDARLHPLRPLQQVLQVLELLQSDGRCSAPQHVRAVLPDPSRIQRWIQCTSGCTGMRGASPRT